MKGSKNSEFNLRVMASRLSGRICEETGALGRLVDDGGYVSCRSREKIASLKNPSPETPWEDEGLPYLTLEERLALSGPTAVGTLRVRYPGVFDDAVEASFPPRFYDLIDVATKYTSNPLNARKSERRIKIDQVTWSLVDGLNIEVDRKSVEPYVSALLIDEPICLKKMLEFGREMANEAEGELTAELFRSIELAGGFVNAMSKCMDPETGSCGPVDDYGQLVMP